MLKIIKTIDKALQKIQEWFLLICVFAMVLLIIWQVVARYVLYISVPYTEELARLSIVWCIFTGASLGIRTGDHIYVEVLLNAMPRMLKLIVRVLIYLLIFAFSAVLVYYGTSVVELAWIDHTTSLGYTRSVFYLPTVVFGTLMAIYSLANCFIFIHEYADRGGESGKEKQ